MEVEQNVRDLYSILKAHSEKIDKWMTALKVMKSKCEGEGYKLTKPSTWPGISYFYKQPKPETILGPASTHTDSQYEQSTDSLVLGDIKSRIRILEENVAFILESMEDHFSTLTMSNQVSPYKIQVYDRDGHVVDDFMTSAAQWIPDQLKLACVKNVTDMDKKKPLLVLCQTRSRLQPDIDYSLEKITDIDEFHAATIVIHSKEEHALPKMSSQCKLGDDERYKNMCLIDAAFTKEMKFYDCEMNSTAAKKLIEFLKKDSSTSV